MEQTQNVPLDGDGLDAVLEDVLLLGLAGLAVDVVSNDGLAVEGSCPPIRVETPLSPRFCSTNFMGAGGAGSVVISTSIQVV